jgi:hypothetical protein
MSILTVGTLNMTAQALEVAILQQNWFAVRATVEAMREFARSLSESSPAAATPVYIVTVRTLDKQTDHLTHNILAASLSLETALESAKRYREESPLRHYWVESDGVPPEILSSMYAESGEEEHITVSVQRISLL